MKNTIRLLGNRQPSRKAAKVPLLIIALAAVIGFSMAACDSGSSSGGSSSESGFSDIDSNGHLGDSVDISGLTVYNTSGSPLVAGANTVFPYYHNSENQSFNSASRNNLASHIPGAAVAIVAGKLELTLGTPSSAETIALGDPSLGIPVDTVGVNAGAQILVITEFLSTDEAGDVTVLVLARDEDTRASFWYTDKAVTLSSDMVDISLSPGWNVAVWEESITSTNALNGFKWFRYQDTFDD